MRDMVTISGKLALICTVAAIALACINLITAAFLYLRLENKYLTLADLCSLRVFTQASCYILININQNR